MVCRLAKLGVIVQEFYIINRGENVIVEGIQLSKWVHFPRR
jgi:hypothetical protein